MNDETEEEKSERRYFEQLQWPSDAEEEASRRQRWDEEFIESFS